MELRSRSSTNGSCGAHEWWGLAIALDISHGVNISMTKVFGII